MDILVTVSQLVVRSPGIQEVVGSNPDWSLEFCGGKYPGTERKHRLVSMFEVLLPTLLQIRNWKFFFSRKSSLVIKFLTSTIIGS